MSASRFAVSNLEDILVCSQDETADVRKLVRSAKTALRRGERVIPDQLLLLVMYVGHGAQTLPWHLIWHVSVHQYMAVYPCIWVCLFILFLLLFSPQQQQVYSKNTTEKHAHERDAAWQRRGRLIVVVVVFVWNLSRSADVHCHGKGKQEMRSEQELKPS